VYQFDLVAAPREPFAYIEEAALLTSSGRRRFLFKDENPHGIKV
jgi:hypothetical protein